MDFTKLPISSGFPSLFIGRVLANASTSSISSLVLSVLIGPGAMLMQLICFFANSLLRILKTLEKAERYALEIISLSHQD